MDALQFHFESAARVQKEIRHFCQNDPDLRQSISFLASLPGVGSITATHAAARLGDWRQISDVRQIAGFLGLVSSEHSTGDKENRGEITRIGDSRLRSKLKAIVAVARKLTTRMYAVLKEQRPFVIRADSSIAPLTAEETAGLRERLDAAQNDQP